MVDGKNNDQPYIILLTLFIIWYSISKYMCGQAVDSIPHKFKD